MTNKASLHTPLMERVVCAQCGHLHRKILVWLAKCACCAADYKKGKA